MASAIHMMATAKPGERVTVPLKLSRNWADFKAPVQVTVLGLPGQGNQPPQPALTIAADKTEGSVVVDVSTPPPRLEPIAMKSVLGPVTYTGRLKLFRSNVSPLENVSVG